MRKFVIIYQNIGLTELCPIEKIKNLVGENSIIDSNFVSFNEKVLKNHFKIIHTNGGWGEENISKSSDGVIFIKSKEKEFGEIQQRYYDECKKQNTPIRIINL